MRSVYVGLGANLGEPRQQLLRALDELARIDEVVLRRRSSLYRSAPMGLPGQADYCNAACELLTAQPAEWLMQELLRIERQLGRFRDGRRWGPRMLDLDLLHVVGESRASTELRLPHPGLTQRNFVLVPLAEIAPELEIPGVGAVAALAATAGREGLSLWQDQPLRALAG